MLILVEHLALQIFLKVDIFLPQFKPSKVDSQAYLCGHFYSMDQGHDSYCQGIIHLHSFVQNSMCDHLDFFKFELHYSTLYSTPFASFIRPIVPLILSDHHQKAWHCLYSAMAIFLTLECFSALWVSCLRLCLIF